jgi:hypothetical protein
MCRDFYQDRWDKLRLSRQIKIFEIFEGNRDFFEINQDFFSLDRDILDFRHLWKVVGEGFTLTFLSLPWVTFWPTTDLYNWNKYLAQDILKIKLFLDRDREKYWEIQKNHKSLDKSQKISISIKISRLSRLTFENCRDCPSCRDQLLKTVLIESLDWDHVKTNRDPQGYIFYIYFVNLPLIAFISLSFPV